MEHPVTGVEFDPKAHIWEMIVDAPKHPRLVSYPGSGQTLYNFKEAVKHVESMIKRGPDAWLESDTMRMDIIAARQAMEDIG